MNKIKYIMIDGLFPVIFSEADTHSDVAGFRNVTSAGFVSFRTNEEGDIQASVYGKSISLGKEFNPHDAAIITRMFSRY